MAVGGAGGVFVPSADGFCGAGGAAMWESGAGMGKWGAADTAGALHSVGWVLGQQRVQGPSMTSFIYRWSIWRGLDPGDWRETEWVFNGALVGFRVLG